MNQTHWIPVAQEQRVDSLGTLSDATKHVWVGLHGYGQLVQFFARHFRSLATSLGLGRLKSLKVGETSHILDPINGMSYKTTYE